MVFDTVVELILSYMAEEGCSVEVAVREIYGELSDCELRSVEHFLCRTGREVSLAGLQFDGKISVGDAVLALYEEFVVRGLCEEVSALIASRA